MWTRREIALGGLLTLVFGEGAFCLCHAQIARRRQSYGCVLSADEASQYFDADTFKQQYAPDNQEMIPIQPSGDKDFDFALANTLAMISETFNVLPGFAYYDEPDRGNAKAIPANLLNRADGTVMFGHRLLRRLLSGHEHPDVSVAAVCAHEFGHILQFKNGRLDRLVIEGQPTVKRRELQADFFAGYFAGVRKLQDKNFPAAVFALTQYNAGDDEQADHRHHGTPRERGAAVARGFEVAFREGRPLSEAIQTSINYVGHL